MRMHRIHSNIEDGLETAFVLTVVDRKTLRETPREVLREAYSCMYGTRQKKVSVSNSSYSLLL